MPTPYCRHIRTNGRRCCAFAVRGQSFCFYHRGINARHRALNPPPDGTQNWIHPTLPDRDGLQREPMLAECYKDFRGPIELQFPTLDDRESIQVALSMLLSALGQNRIEPKRAVSMLYGLQVASSNARDLRTTPSENRTVRDTVMDDSGVELALDQDPQDIPDDADFPDPADLDPDEDEDYDHDDPDYEDEDGGDRDERDENDDDDDDR